MLLSNLVHNKKKAGATGATGGLRNQLRYKFGMLCLKIYIWVLTTTAGCGRVRARQSTLEYSYFVYCGLE